MKRGLVMLFVLYAALFAIFSSVVVNPYLIRCFSLDSQLSPSTMSRLHWIQLGFGVLACLSIVVAIGLRRLFRGMNVRPVVGQSIMGVSWCLVLVACCEGVLAVKYPPAYLPSHSTREPLALTDPLLGYRLNPAYADGYQIGPQGFRNANTSSRETAGAVYCVGDSITFGLELNDEATPYPACLERLLGSSAPPERVVINAGTPGYASLNVLQLMKTRIVPARPRLVVLCVGWNDLISGMASSWCVNSLLTGVQKPIDHTPLAIMRFIVEVRRQWLQKKGGGAHYVRQEARKDALPCRPEVVENYAKNLDAIITLCQSNQLPLLVFNMPTVVSEKLMTPSERIKAGPFTVAMIRPFEEVSLRLCREKNVFYLGDVFPLEMNGKDDYFLDHCHVSAKGAARIAEQVFEKLQEIQVFAGQLQPDILAK